MSALYEYTTTRRRISDTPATVCDTPASAYAAVRDLADEEREHLIVVLLNRKNRAVGRETLYIGTVSGSPVRIAELFTLAVRQCADGILLAHNHPSGDPAPSADDLRTTREAAAAGKLLGIRVVDHIIVGEAGRFHSMREQSPESFMV